MNAFARTAALLTCCTLFGSESEGQVFLIDAKNAEYIAAAAYAPATNSVLFFSGSAMAPYDLSSTEPVSLTWYDLGDIADIDAAIGWSDSTVLIFSGNSYRTFDVLTGSTSAELLEWPGLPNGWNDSLDAAVRWSEDEVMFFWKDEFLIYDFTEEAYTVHDRMSSWDGYPEHWTTPLEAAMNISGEIYFLNDGEAVLYSTNEQKFFIPSPIGIADAAGK